jgi:glycosyltransferase involved in cell wall biosynthesis
LPDDRLAVSEMPAPTTGLDPNLSVVLPTYNRAHLLSRSIASVLNQTYSDFELLVVDDGSTDATDSVVSGFLDRRIRYVRCDCNRGPGAARNVGIQIARGTFIAFQDSDDEWMPDKLEHHMQAFAMAPAAVGVVYSDMARVLADGRVEYHQSPTVVRRRLIDPATGFYQVYKLGIQSVVVRRECLSQVGPFNEQLPALEDLELFIRLAHLYEFVHVHKPLVRYHQRDGRSTSLAAEYRARCLLLQMHYREISRCGLLVLLKEASLFVVAVLARRPLPALLTRLLRAVYRPRVATAVRRDDTGGVRLA